MRDKCIKKRRIISGCLVTAVSLIPLAIIGCSQEENKDITENTSQMSDFDYQIYCVNEEGTGLEQWGYNISDAEMALDNVVNKVFAAFVDEPEIDGASSAMPDTIKKVTCVVEENIAKINVDKYYDKLDSLTQLYMRAALALTLTQIDGIDYVYITVKGQPLTDSEGKVVGYLSEKDFAVYDQGGFTSENEIYMSLYYPNESGDGLITERSLHVLEAGENPVMYILERLRESIAKSGIAGIPESTVVDNVYIKDGICYVNFDDSINDDKYIGIEPEVMLYSIVNSITDLSNISGVQITINGGTDILFRGEINLDRIFRLNLNYMEKK